MVLIINEIFFLTLVPWFLLIPAFFIEKNLIKQNPLDFQSNFGILIALAGLFFSLSAVRELWKKGKGTPSFHVPTENLVTSGVYILCRNPIQLGSLLYVFGLGAVLFSLLTALIAMLAGIITAIVYIKKIETRELLIRFEKEYEEYNKETPFLIPNVQSIKQYTAYIREGNRH